MSYWVCDECAEKDSDVYDEGKILEADGLECELCEKPTNRLTRPMLSLEEQLNAD